MSALPKQPVLDLIEPSQLQTALLGKELIWTPEYERLGQQVARWICLEMPGAFVYGIQRSGKTNALRMLTSKIADFIGSSVYCTYVSAAADMSEKGAGLVAEWLNRERVLYTGTNAFRLQRKLKEHFEEQAQLLETAEVCLIVDEAQYLSRAHLFKLLHLGNILGDAGLRVFTLVTGQPELASQVDGFAAMSELHLLGRFFERRHEFLAIAPSEIETVIRAHEANVSDVDGTQLPPTVASVFPQAWEQGWRPSNWSPAICGGIALAAKKNSLPRDQRIPMQHLRGCLLWLILRMKQAVDPWIAVTPQLVLSALEEVGLAGNWARYAAARSSMRL